MFTGIVKGIAEVVSHEIKDDNSSKLIISKHNALANCMIDDSIAVNGVCLTLVTIDDMGLHFDLAPETINITNLRNFKAGSFVNVEPALLASSPMGGHNVQGHVDTTAIVKSLHKDANSTRFDFSCKYDFAKFNIPKGFIALDGISLTLTDIQKEGFSVMIIPHTMEHTIAKYWQEGASINVEIDMMAKAIYTYLEHFSNQK